jgi:hypothetical protein
MRELAGDQEPGRKGRWEGREALVAEASLLSLRTLGT